LQNDVIYISMMELDACDVYLCRLCCVFKRVR